MTLSGYRRGVHDPLSVLVVHFSPYTDCVSSGTSWQRTDQATHTQSVGESLRNTLSKESVVVRPSGVLIKLPIPNSSSLLPVTTARRRRSTVLSADLNSDVTAAVVVTTVYRRSLVCTPLFGRATIVAATHRCCRCRGTHNHRSRHTQS